MKNAVSTLVESTVSEKSHILQANRIASPKHGRFPPPTPRARQWYLPYGLGSPLRELAGQSSQYTIHRLWQGFLSNPRNGQTSGFGRDRYIVIAIHFWYLPRIQAKKYFRKLLIRHKESIQWKRIESKWVSIVFAFVAMIRYFHFQNEDIHVRR